MSEYKEGRIRYNGKLYPNVGEKSWKVRVKIMVRIAGEDRHVYYVA